MKSNIVHITKKDEVYIQFQTADPGIILEISEHFTFFAEGYKFSPAFKNKMWDGKIKLVNLRNQTLLHGLLANLIAFCKSRDYTIELDKNIAGNEITPSVEEIQEFVNSIPISSRGVKINLRDYQFDGIQQAIRENRLLLLSPTGSGKSLIIYMILRWYLENSDEKKRILIVVPTKSLVSQMQSDFADYSEFDSEFNADKDVHIIFSGKEKHKFKSRVVVTTWQSAIKLNKDWFQQYGMVIGDEAHTFKSKSLNTISQSLIYANYRIGTTGTIDNTQCNKLVLIGNFGPVHRVTSTKKLMDDSTLSKLHIHCLALKYPDDVRKLVSKIDYQTEIDFIVAHPSRNRFIKNLVLDLKGNTIILFNLVKKHGKPLHKLISEHNTDSDRKIFYVSGEVDSIQREEIRGIVEKEGEFVSLSFGNKSIKIHNNDIVPLNDGTSKAAHLITIDDDIDDTWLTKNLL